MRVETGSCNSDLRVFQDAQVHVLTPLQTHTDFHANCFPELHEPVSLLVVVSKIHPASCLCEEAGLPFVGNKHHDNSNHWEQEMQRTDRNTHRCQT